MLPSLVSTRSTIHRLWLSATVRVSKSANRLPSNRVKPSSVASQRYPLLPCINARTTGLCRPSSVCQSLREYSSSGSCHSCRAPKRAVEIAIKTKAAPAKIRIELTENLKAPFMRHQIGNYKRRMATSDYLMNPSRCKRKIFAGRFAFYLIFTSGFSDKNCRFARVFIKGKTDLRLHSFKIQPPFHDLHIHEFSQNQTKLDSDLFRDSSDLRHQRIRHLPFFSRQRAHFPGIHGKTRSRNGKRYQNPRRQFSQKQPDWNLFRRIGRIDLLHRSGSSPVSGKPPSASGRSWISSDRTRSE